MGKKDLVSAYGLGAEAMTMMSKLARQVVALGGDEADLRQLNEDELISRLAKVVVRRGRFNRPMDNPIYNVHFLSFEDNSSSFSDAIRRIESSGFQLVSKLELKKLITDFPDLLNDEDFIIVGAPVMTGSNVYNTISKGCELGMTSLSNIDDNNLKYRFAVSVK